MNTIKKITDTIGSMNIVAITPITNRSFASQGHVVTYDTGKLLFSKIEYVTHFVTGGGDRISGTYTYDVFEALEAHHARSAKEMI